MPIVFRSVDIQPMKDGSVFASFLVKDDKGRSYGKSRHRYSNEREAREASETFDWSSQQREADVRDSIRSVEEGGTVNNRTRDYKTELTRRLTIAQNDLDDMTILRNRLQSALDKANG